MMFVRIPSQCPWVHMVILRKQHNPGSRRGPILTGRAVDVKNQDLAHWMEEICTSWDIVCPL